MSDGDFTPGFRHAWLRRWRSWLLRLVLWDPHYVIYRTGGRNGRHHHPAM